MKINEGKAAIQGSPEWLEWRKSHITASNVAVILGMNPWRAEYDYWLEMTGQCKPVVLSDIEQSRMDEGNRLEPIARAHYEEVTGIKFNPIVAEHDTISYLGASLDGISIDRKHAIEIKCGAKSYEQAKSGVIPGYYMAQCQHIYLVCNVSSLDYVAFRLVNEKPEMIVIPVPRDEVMIERIKHESERFWYCVENFISPNTFERKYEVVNEI